MKIAIMGSGGVGGYFGARLANSGNEVSFIARGDHLAAMREHGLKVESGLGDIHLPKVSVTDDPRTIGKVDLVLFSVKLRDTEAAAQSIKPLFGPDTGIVSFQNGVQKDDILRGVFGDKPVMGGVAYIATAIGRPGVIKHTGTLQRLVFGEHDGPAEPAGPGLDDALAKVEAFVVEQHARGGITETARQAIDRALDALQERSNRPR